GDGRLRAGAPAAAAGVDGAGGAVGRGAVLQLETAGGALKASGAPAVHGGRPRRPRAGARPLPRRAGVFGGPAARGRRPGPRPRARTSATAAPSAGPPCPLSR